MKPIAEKITHPDFRVRAKRIINMILEDEIEDNEETTEMIDGVTATLLTWYAQDTSVVAEQLQKAGGS